MENKPHLPHLFRPLYQEMPFFNIDKLKVFFYALVLLFPLLGYSVQGNSMNPTTFDRKLSGPYAHYQGVKTGLI